MPIRIGRWHIEYHQRAIHIVREPAPNCPDCNGTGGGWIGTSQHADWDECACLDDVRTWRLPLWLRATRQYTEEPF
ncbi:hypothetical protein [Streptomyces niveus]|uniref:hypothetical protein n=1 Tax=Streptomyces niveus TaxID=193462 RepID=UPI003442F4D9